MGAWVINNYTGTCVDMYIHVVCTLSIEVSTYGGMVDVMCALDRYCR